MSRDANNNLVFGSKNERFELGQFINELEIYEQNFNMNELNLIMEEFGSIRLDKEVCGYVWR